MNSLFSASNETNRDGVCLENVNGSVSQHRQIIRKYSINYESLKTIAVGGLHSYNCLKCFIASAIGC